jgi:phosphate starvation-inducible membrane PsiE
MKKAKDILGVIVKTAVLAVVWFAPAICINEGFGYNLAEAIGTGTEQSDYAFLKAMTVLSSFLTVVISSTLWAKHTGVRYALSVATTQLVTLMLVIPPTTSMLLDNPSESFRSFFSSLWFTALFLVPAFALTVTVFYATPKIINSWHGRFHGNRLDSSTQASNPGP